MPKTCCGTSVGVLVFDAEAERLLMITRGTAPAGVAPVAGHALDEHASYQDAARAEVHEEVGLKVTNLTGLAVGGFHPGRCRRIPRNGGGHDWEIYSASVSGDLAPSQREVAAVAWYSRREVQALAERTAAYANGAVSEQDWLDVPGLEPVWCDWLAQLGWVRLPEADLDRIRRVAATPPVANL